MRTAAPQRRGGTWPAPVLPSRSWLPSTSDQRQSRDLLLKKAPGATVIHTSVGLGRARRGPELQGHGPRLTPQCARLTPTSGACGIEQKAKTCPLSSFLFRRPSSAFGPLGHPRRAGREAWCQVHERHFCAFSRMLASTTDTEAWSSEVPGTTLRSRGLYTKASLQGEEDTAGSWT